MLVCKKPTLLLLTLLFLGFACCFSVERVFANEICPAVNCDCASLPSEPWQTVCLSHELKLKKQCAANGNVSTDFCSLHGPSATPLPVLVKLDDVSILPTEEIKEANERVSTMFWSLGVDLKVVTAMLRKKMFGEAQATLKLVDKNVNSLFLLQRQITSSNQFYSRERASRKAWKSYSPELLERAKFMYEVGQSLREQSNLSTDSKEQKAYSVMSMKILRLSSKVFEMAGIAYAGAEEPTDAAQAWKGAANVSRAIMVFKSEDKANPKYVEYYRKQTAMRLHRASYYWMLSEDENNARDSLQSSVEFMDNKSELNVLLHIQSATNEGTPTTKLANSILF